MASTTVHSNGTSNGASNGAHEGDVEVGLAQNELEPLLGRRGDAAQKEGSSLYSNLVLGTGVLAQFGVFILVAAVWASVFLHRLILFSVHPLLQSAGVLFLVQAILILQPTHTAEQKQVGRVSHGVLMFLGAASLVAGIIVIEYNKISGNNPHFHSLHGYLGVISGAVLLLQYFVGVTMWLAPGLYGGEERAKSVWKYHRMSGYLLLLLLLATVCSATWTPAVATLLKLKPWGVVLACVFIAIGVFPRVQKQKLGFGPKAPLDPEPEDDSTADLENPARDTLVPS